MQVPDHDNPSNRGESNSLAFRRAKKRLRREQATARVYERANRLKDEVQALVWFDLRAGLPCNAEPVLTG
jgi:hypothetical protein